MMVATEPSLKETNEYLNAVYVWGGFEDHSGFMIFLSLSVLGIFLFKNSITLLINYS